MKHKKQNSLFGVKSRIGKATILVVFTILSGGIGLIIVLLAMLGDRAKSRRNNNKDIFENEGTHDVQS